MFIRKPGWSSLLLAVLLFEVTTVSGWAQKCSLATLKGTYGVLEQGTIVAQLPGFPPPPFPVVLAANATYDGAGNELGTFKLSLGGVPVAGTFAGTYTVNSDCTYTETFVATPPGIAALHVSGIIIGEGTFREIHYIYTDSGRVISGTAKKAPPGGCSLNSVKGDYAVFGQGTVPTGPPPAPPILVAHVGPFTADGAGHLSGSEDVTLGGIFLQDTFTADAAINPDCTFALVITDSTGLVVHEWGTITGEGRSQEFDAIVTDPGWVFVESVKKQ